MARNTERLVESSLLFASMDHVSGSMASQGDRSAHELLV
jgi:hypothetical protein